MEPLTPEQLQELEAERVSIAYRTGVKLTWAETLKAAEAERFPSPHKKLQQQKRGEIIEHYRKRLAR